MQEPERTLGPTSAPCPRRGGAAGPAASCPGTGISLETEDRCSLARLLPFPVLETRTPPVKQHPAAGTHQAPPGLAHPPQVPAGCVLLGDARGDRGGGRWAGQGHVLTPSQARAKFSIFMISFLIVALGDGLPSPLTCEKGTV